MKYTLIAAMFAACTLALSACGEKKQAEAPAPTHEVIHEVPVEAPAHEAAPEVHIHEAAPEVHTHEAPAEKK